MRSIYVWLSTLNLRDSCTLSRRITGFQLTNDLQTFDDVTEVKEFINKATLLKQELIEINTDLEIALSEPEYEKLQKLYIQEEDIVLKKSLEKREKQENEREEKEVKGGESKKGKGRNGRKRKKGECERE